MSFQLDGCCNYPTNGIVDLVSIVGPSEMAHHLDLTILQSQKSGEKKLEDLILLRGCGQKPMLALSPTMIQQSAITPSPCSQRSNLPTEKVHRGSVNPLESSKDGIELPIFVNLSFPASYV